MEYTKQNKKNVPYGFITPHKQDQEAGEDSASVAMARPGYWKTKYWIVNHASKYFIIYKL